MGVFWKYIILQFFTALLHLSQKNPDTQLYNMSVVEQCPTF